MAEIDGEQYAARKLGCEISADPLNPLEPIKKVCKSHHPGEDLSILDRAYRRAVIQHSAQRRKSGEPYIIHPLAVSQILADLGMGPIVVAAGLLHDTVEDTDYMLDQCRAEFGAALIQHVVGVLHRVMQQTGRHHNRPHAQIRENLGNGQRVDDVRLARLAALGGVLDDGAPVRAVEDGQILTGMVGLAHFLDWFQRIERIGADLATQFTGGVLLAINLCHASHLPRHEVHCNREPVPCARTRPPSLVPQPLLPSSPWSFNRPNPVRTPLPSNRTRVRRDRIRAVSRPG